MADRQQLHTALKNMMVSLGLSPKVYFQPPENIKMDFPCIVYTRIDIPTLRADDSVYKYTIGYQVELIDRSSDTIMLDRILTSFTRVRWQRHFVSGNLHHDVLYLYY